MIDLRAELAATRRALGQRDELIGRIAHELRSPVATLLLWETILRSAAEDGLRGQALDAIRRCAQTQESLVSAMLDLGRLLAGTLELDRRPVPIEDAIVDALTSIAAAAADKQLRIERESGDDQRALVSADPMRLRQIVSILISSVVESAEPGGRIVVSVRRVAASVVIDVAVADGAPANARTFDDEAPRGIELALARELTVAHGGTCVTKRSGDTPAARCTLPIVS